MQRIQEIKSFKIMLENVQILLKSYSHFVLSEILMNGNKKVKNYVQVRIKEDRPDFSDVQYKL